MATTTEQKVYTCTRCGYFSAFKFNVVKHLKNVDPCPPKIQDIPREEVLKLFGRPEPLGQTVNCPLCNKTIVKACIARHKKTCQKSHGNISQQAIVNSTSKTNEPMETKNLQQTIQEQRQLIQYLTQENEALKARVVTVSFNFGDSSRDQHKEVKTNKNKQKIKHAVKVKVWDKYVGDTIGKAKCFCCQNIDITQHNFHCGHVQAEACGGTLHIDNLRPICGVCNNSMGTQNLMEFKEKYFGEK